MSRLIESKPEELRVFIEEAAGISKYKERRRETESRMRRTNRAFKLDFPEAMVRAYGRGFLEQGNDAVVLGHFHIEKELRVSVDGSSGRVFVLPEWKGARRHMEVSADGEMGLVDS